MSNRITAIFACFFVFFFGQCLSANHSFVNGHLTINLSNSGDTVFLRDVGWPGSNDLEMVIWHNQVQSVTPLSGVKSIRINGGTGNDTITNNTNVPMTVYCGPGNDRVFGGFNVDEIYGGPGDDLIVGNGGNDLLLGEDGEDGIAGGEGNDLIVGGRGDDDIQGGNGHDGIDAGDGDDWIGGGAGVNIIWCGNGDDLVKNRAHHEPWPGTSTNVVFGGNGNDEIHGDKGNTDYLFGGNGNDYCNGNGGQDWIEGNDGNDEIVSGTGASVINAGYGNDIVTTTDDGQPDYVADMQGETGTFNLATGDTQVFHTQRYELVTFMYYYSANWFFTEVYQLP